MEITNKKILQIRKKILSTGKNLDCLIIGYPKGTNKIKIGEKTIVLTGSPLILKAFGINIWVDNGVPEDSCYFLDKKEMVIRKT